MKLTQNKIYFLVAIAASVFFDEPAFAQGTATKPDGNYFKVSGQFRLRPEFRNGYRMLASDTSSEAFFIAQRSRLIFDYKKDKTVFYSSIQDSRTWGDEEQRKDIGGLQVNELWVELALPKGLSLKMGRQELAYDDHRILGNLDWANLTISHDALLIKYASKNKRFKWHIGGAYNQTGEPLFGTKYTLKNYKYLGFSWVKKDLPKIHGTLTALAIINGLNPTDTLKKATLPGYTFGPVFSYLNKGWKALAGAYYQAGKTDNDLTVNAYMLNGYAEYRKKKLFAGLGGDLLSGNTDNTQATESNNFSTLYATNHKFYGYMDYFLTIPSDTKQRGLMDLYLRMGVVPTKATMITVDVHSFSLANARNTGAQKTGKDLGTEFDLLFDYKPSALLYLQAGYSMMFATKNMEQIKGGNANNYNGWAYVMLKVSPTLFFHEITN